MAEANRGERPEFAPTAGRFDAETLMAAACERNGRAGFGDGDFVEPLSVFCSALEDEARLTPLGRWATERYLGRLLDVRLLLDAYQESDPTIGAEAISDPIFVIGAPRTGTTVVHRLLGSDPAHRVPEGWEFCMPLPPPEPDTHHTDPRIDAMAEELVFPQSVAAGLRAIHTYSARMPKECLSAMAFSCRTEEFISRYNVPSYVEWLRTADRTPAYDMHKRVLQVLQRKMPDRRWVLKSPVHLQAIPTLAATYPDARYIITHRDPAAVLASVSSLIATLRSAFSDEVDAQAIGRYHLDLYRHSLDALVDHVDGGVLAADRSVHVRHADLATDQLTTLEAIYDGLDLHLDATTREAAAAEIAGDREDALGAHHYELADFDLDRAELAEAFSRYRDRFDA